MNINLNCELFNLTYYIILVFVLIITLINKNDMEIRYNDAIYKARSYWKKLESLNINMSKDKLLDNNLLYKPLEKNNKFAIITYENRKNFKYVKLL